MVKWDELLEKGLLEQLENEKVVRLAFDHEQFGKLLDDNEQEWHDETKQLMVASAVGDWFLLEKLIVKKHSIIVKENLEACCDQRTTYLVHLYRSGTAQEDALEALHDLSSPMLATLLSEALRGKPSGTTSAALAIIDEWDDTKWCDDLHALMNRVNANGEIPEPHIWYTCAQFLLRHRRTSNIKQQLRRIKSNCLGEASILSLEYFPDIAIETFRRALKSEIPCNRITAAASLAIIDQPWSRKELSAVLDESDDHVMTTECRSALLATHSEECHQLVSDWEKRNPREPEQGPFITMGKMILRQSDGTIHWEMEKLHDRVMRLRSTEPDVPST